MNDVGRAGPIFIHGILPRCGTNFLWDLLLLHPDCAPPLEPVREDLFLEHSDDLVSFARAVQSAWDPRWGAFGPEHQSRLQAALGDGLLSFLWADPSRRVVVKNPSVRHLERFFHFFPEAYLIVLIRDGRSVVQSCMDTFGWSFERAARAWSLAAAEINRVRTAGALRTSQWRLVRYEDLIDDLDGELISLLQFVGLDPGRYDLQAAHKLPVRGSSVFFGPGRSGVNWDPVQRDSSFSPKERWQSWSASDLDRFDWLAGHQLRAFGYDTNAPPPRSPRSAARHLLLDAGWTARQTAHLTRRWMGAASRPLRRRLGLIQ